MAKRVVRRSTRERDAMRALEDALDPIEDAHTEAKDAFREVVSSGDPVSIREAKAAKVAAADHLEATRTWLRREAAIVKLSTVIIPDLQRRLAGPILVKRGDDTVEDAEMRAQLEARLQSARADLEAFVAEAIPVRRELEALGGQIQGDPVPADLPPGSADVTAPTISVETTVNRTPNAKAGN